MKMFRPAAGFVASAIAAAAIINAPVQAAEVQIAASGPVVELTVTEQEVVFRRPVMKKNKGHYNDAK